MSSFFGLSCDRPYWLVRLLLVGAASSAASRLLRGYGSVVGPPVARINAFQAVRVGREREARLVARVLRQVREVVGHRTHGTRRGEYHSIADSGRLEAGAQLDGHVHLTLVEYLGSLCSLLQHPVVLHGDRWRLLTTIFLINEVPLREELPLRLVVL